MRSLFTLGPSRSICAGLPAVGGHAGRPALLAHAVDVRPFWGRAGRYFGGVLAGIYLFGALSFFAFLRTIGYPISIVHVV